MANPIALIALAAGAFFLLGRKEGEVAGEIESDEGDVLDEALSEDDADALSDAQQSMGNRDVELGGGVNLQGGGTSIQGTAVTPSAGSITTLGQLQPTGGTPWIPPSTMGMKTGNGGRFYWVIGGQAPAFYSIRKDYPYDQNEVENRLVDSLEEAYDAAQERAAWFAAWGHG